MNTNKLLTKIALVDDRIKAIWVILFVFSWIAVSIYAAVMVLSNLRDLIDIDTNGDPVTILSLIYSCFNFIFPFYLLMKIGSKLDKHLQSMPEYVIKEAREIINRHPIAKDTLKPYLSEPTDLLKERVEKVKKYVGLSDEVSDLNLRVADLESSLCDKRARLTRLKPQLYEMKKKLLPSQNKGG